MMRPGKFPADLQKHIITSSLKPDPENNKPLYENQMKTTHTISVFQSVLNQQES